MFHSVGGATSGGWNIWTNGYISTQHTFSGAATQLTVRAAGQFAGNAWPLMRVTVNGTHVFQGSVSSASWASYTFPAAPSAGSKEVRIYFTNDFNQGGADRNLLVDKLSTACVNVCGDGVLGGSEECDDGNTVNTDSCTAACRWNSCGDGFTYQTHTNESNPNPSETCDDGNTAGGDGCSPICRVQ